MQAIEPPERLTELLERWQRCGDRDALDGLLRAQIQELKRRVLRRADGILRSSGSASDVVQDAVLRVLRRDPPPRFRSEEGLRAYLWRAAERLLADRLRRRRRQPLSLDANPADFDRLTASAGSLAEVERRDGANRLRVCIEFIDTESRHLLEMALLHQHSYQQIGDSLGISHQAAKMRVLRAKRRLLRRLENWDTLLR